MEVLSCFFSNDPPIQSINNWIDSPLLNLMQRGFLSPSSPNNQPILSINHCINWLLLILVWRGLLSPSSPNYQSILSINSCIDQLLFNSKWWGFLSPSFPNSQPILSINDCIDPVLLSSMQRDCFLLPLPISNQLCQSSRNTLVDYFLTQWRGLLSPSSLNNQPKQWQYKGSSSTKCCLHCSPWICTFQTFHVNQYLLCSWFQSTSLQPGVLFTQATKIQKSKNLRICSAYKLHWHPTNFKIKSGFINVVANGDINATKNRNT